MSSNEERVRIPVRTFEEPTSILEKMNTLQEVFDPTNKSNIYNYISSISRENLLFYMVIILIIAIVFSKINLQLNIMVGVIIGLMIVYYLISKSEVLNDSEFAILEIKLESIKPTPKFFYVDANLIELMYNLLEYSSYSPDDYANTILHIDNILKLQLDIENGMEDCDAVMDVIRDEHAKAIESLSGMLIAIPGESIVLKNKLVDGIKNLELFLQRHITICDRMCGSIKLA